MRTETSPTSGTCSTPRARPWSSLGGTTFYDYDRDRKLQLAVERLVEIIGEAARHVSEPFREQHTDIPWRKIVAQRHVLAHDYGDLQQERLWLLVTEHLPDLIRRLAPLVPPAPEP